MTILSHIFHRVLQRKNFENPLKIYTVIDRATFWDTVTCTAHT